MSTIKLVETLKRIERNTSTRGRRQREFVATWIEAELERRAVVAQLFAARWDIETRTFVRG